MPHDGGGGDGRCGPDRTRGSVRGARCPCRRRCRLLQGDGRDGRSSGRRSRCVSRAVRAPGVPSVPGARHGAEGDGGSGLHARSLHRCGAGGLRPLTGGPLPADGVQRTGRRERRSAGGEGSGEGRVRGAGRHDLLRGGGGTLGVGLRCAGFPRVGFLRVGFRRVSPGCAALRCTALRCTTLRCTCRRQRPCGGGTFHGRRGALHGGRSRGCGWSRCLGRCGYLSRRRGRCSCWCWCWCRCRCWCRRRCRRRRRCCGRYRCSVLTTDRGGLGGHAGGLGGCADQRLPLDRGSRGLSGARRRAVGGWRLDRLCAGRNVLDGAPGVATPVQRSSKSQTLTACSTGPPRRTMALLPHCSLDRPTRSVAVAGGRARCRAWVRRAGGRARGRGRGRAWGRWARGRRARPRGITGVGVRARGRARGRGGSGDRSWVRGRARARCCARS